MYFLIEKEGYKVWVHKYKLESDHLSEVTSPIKRKDESLCGMIYNKNVYQYPALLFHWVHRRLQFPTPLKLGVVMDE